MHRPERSTKLSLLAVAAVGEAVTGMVLLVYPPICAHLLFGADATGMWAIVSRIAGIALVALGTACWPGRDRTANHDAALLGMLTYTLLVAVYLGYLGIQREWVGPLLWPAVVLHTALGILLVRGWLQDRHAHAPA